MSGKSFVFSWQGVPQLDQLHDDLRAAEMFMEAPRFSVPESQYRALSGEFWREGGKVYKLVDIRDLNSSTSGETPGFVHVMGAFELVQEIHIDNGVEVKIYTKLRQHIDFTKALG